jgi:hypothetical protein
MKPLKYKNFIKEHNLTKDEMEDLIIYGLIQPVEMTHLYTGRSYIMDTPREQLLKHLSRIKEDRRNQELADELEIEWNI